MKTVLAISYKKNIRTRKFCKYLPLYGFNPIILTEEGDSVRAGDKADNQCIENADPTETVRASNFLHLERVTSTSRVGFNYRFFVLPDPFITWIPNAFVKGLKLCRANKIDYIYASGGPFSAMIVGYLLKKKTHIPLILDFRDPWTLDEDVLMRYPSRFHKGIDQFIERHVLIGCDRMVTATNFIAQDYVRLYPELRHKIRTICNGFDSADLERPRTRFQTFTITHTGTLYGSGERPYELFLRALRNCIERELIRKEEVQVLLIGSKTPRLISDIERYDLQTIVTATERVAYKKALWYAASSSLLLVLERSHAVTTKVYEYLATGVPILAIVREGELEKLVGKYATQSYVITSNDEQEIADSITAAYHNWQSSKVRANTNRTEEYADRYERKNLTKQLGDVFTSVHK